MNEQNTEETNISKYKVFKAKQIDEIEGSYVYYDEETIKLMIQRLEDSIKKAKLRQLESWLNQDKSISTAKISEAERKLTGEEREYLSRFIKKIGGINGIKLMMLLEDDVTPEEQKEIYKIFKENLNDDEMVKLRDILDVYIME